MAAKRFSTEELNFFKFASIVLNEFPRMLRSIFVTLWDSKIAPLVGNKTWDDTPAVRNLLLACEGKTKIPTSKSFKDWDCTALFNATIHAKTFATSTTSPTIGKPPTIKTLKDQFIEGKIPNPFHSTLISPTGNNDETIALATDQLRLLRNALCHLPRSTLEKATFDNYVQLAKDAFAAVKFPTCQIDYIGNLDEKEFPTEKVDELKRKIRDVELENYNFLMENVNKKITALIDECQQNKQFRESMTLKMDEILDILANGQESRKGGELEFRFDLESVAKPVIHSAQSQHAIKRCLGGVDRDDQKFKKFKDGSVIVPLNCFTDERFLEVLNDFESGRLKERLLKEFSQIGVKTEEMKIEIINIEEVNKTKEAIKIRNTAKMWNAIKKGDTEEVRRLVPAYVDVNGKVTEELSLLHLAAQFGSLDIVKHLVEHGAEVSNDDNSCLETVLHSACRGGSDTIVQYLLQHGATKDINRKNPSGRSPLSVACSNYHKAVVQTLVKAHDDTRCRSDEIILSPESAEPLEEYQKRERIKQDEELNEKQEREEPTQRPFSPKTLLKMCHLNLTAEDEIFLRFIERLSVDSDEKNMTDDFPKEATPKASEERPLAIQPSESIAQDIKETEKDDFLKDILNSKYNMKKEVHEKIRSFSWLRGAYGITGPNRRIPRIHIYLTVKRGIKKSEVLKEIKKHFKCDPRKYFELFRESKRKSMLKHLSKPTPGGSIVAVNRSSVPNPLRVKMEDDDDEELEMNKLSGTLTMFCFENGKHYALTCFHVGCPTDDFSLAFDWEYSEFLANIRGSVESYEFYAREQEYRYRERDIDLAGEGSENLVASSKYSFDRESDIMSIQVEEAVQVDCRVKDIENPDIDHAGEGSEKLVASSTKYTLLGELSKYSFDAESDIMSIQVEEAVQVDCRIKDIENPDWAKIWKELHWRVIHEGGRVIVQKVGALANDTHKGYIVDLNFSLRYKDQILFSDAIVIKGVAGKFLEDGDSGALLYFLDNNQVKQPFAYAVCEFENFNTDELMSSEDDSSESDSSEEDCVSESSPKVLHEKPMREVSDKGSGSSEDCVNDSDDEFIYFIEDQGPSLICLKLDSALENLNLLDKGCFNKCGSTR